MSRYIEYDCPDSERFGACNLCQRKERCNAKVKQHGLCLDDEVTYYQYPKVNLFPCAYCGAEMKLIKKKNGVDGAWHYDIESKHSKNCLLRYANIILPTTTTQKEIIKMCNRR